MAIVLGDMDLVRTLGLAGIRCAVVSAPGATVQFSRFVDSVITWDGDWSDAEDLADQLVTWSEAQTEPPVLFYQHDEHTLFVSRHRQRLASVMRFTIAPADQLETMVDKVRFYALAGLTGVSMPRTNILDPLSAFPSDLEFPIIVKPRTRANPRWSEIEPDAKAFRVGSVEELRTLWPLLSRFGDSLVAQQIVSGPEDRICSYHAYVSPEGEVLGEFTGRKIRTLPREFGHTTALEITIAPDVADAGRDVMRRLALTGVAKVDFKRGPDGKLWLLEVNPRFNLWHLAGAVAGVNLPAMVWADLVGTRRPVANGVRAGTRWCNVNDVRAGREWGVPLHRWLAWFMRCEVKASLAWDDPKPVVGRLLWVARHRRQRHDSSAVDQVPDRIPV